jgi:cyclophilin family peptidyl-prolyl cis-trans isomerase
LAPPQIVPTGDPALDALQRRFTDLSRWLASRPRLGADERAEINRFRTAAMACKADHPKNPAVVAMLAQAAAWIGDDEDVEGQFRHLAELRPDDGNVIATWCDYWLGRAQPETALVRLERHPRDLEGHPRLALARAQTFAALERWEEAQAALDVIPTTAMLPPATTGKLVELRRVVAECLAAWPQEQMFRVKEGEADDLPRVELQTSRGPIVLELFENQAPNTVANFISLVEKGFYDGTKLAGTRTGTLVTGGDPTTKPGAAATPGVPGGPGYTIADECALPEARKHFRGSVAMSALGPDLAGSQFYIAIAPAVHNNGVRTVFGRVIDGMPIAVQLGPTDSITAAKVLRTRDHAYTPVTR